MVEDIRPQDEVSQLASASMGALGPVLPSGLPDAAVHWIIDRLPTFVGVCTPEGVILQANEALLLAGNVTSRDVVGLPLWEARWWGEDAVIRRQLGEAVDAARRGQTARSDIRITGRSGRRMSIDFQLAPIVEDGRVTALVASGSDISDRIEERDRLEALASLSRLLNGAVTTDDVARLVVQHAHAVIHASFVNVGLVGDDGAELHLTHPAMDTDLTARWTAVPLTGGVRTPFHDALDTGTTVVVDRALRAERYPEMVEDTDRVGLDTTAVVPLFDVTGEVFGGLGVGWDEPTRLTANLRARLDLLADLCGRALERARRTEVQDKLVHRLQDEVLSARDWPDSLDVAVGYEAAHSELGFGGDWFDVIEVDDDETAFVVGDVAGHGINAAARMTATRATIRDMVLTTTRDEVLPSATRALRYFDSAYVATTVVAWVERRRQTVCWQLAGHLPPVLRTPDGETRLLHGPHHPPLGMPATPRAVPEAPFPPGSLLVLYTDGLIERRGTDIDESLERLRATIAATPLGITAEALRAQLLGTALESRTSDDVAIVVVRSPD